jgi:hypothetical protein
MIPVELEDTITTARRLQISTLYFSSRTLTILTPLGGCYPNEIEIYESNAQTRRCSNHP